MSNKKPRSAKAQRKYTVAFDRASQRLPTVHSDEDFMTSKITDDETKKALAVGRNREVAASVLVPRILGALEHDGHALHHPNSYPMLVAARDQLLIHLFPSPGFLFLRVHWQELLVLSGAVHLDGLGEYYAGRVSVPTWERGPDSRAWQTELFDAFSSDSERLLTIPMSELATAVAGLLQFPATEVEKMVSVDPITWSRGITAQHLWRDLVDACDRAGQGQLTTEELGQVVFELGLGLLASERDKDQLLALMAQVCDQIEHDGLSIVNAALVRNFRDPHLAAHSSIRTLSGLDDDPSWASGQMRMVGELRPSASAPKKGW